MRILLTSSPEMDQAVFQEIARLLDGKPDISVGFIMSSPEYANDPQGLEKRMSKVAEHLRGLGFKKAVGYYLAHHNADDLIHELRAYDVICLRGSSNAFHTLKLARQVGLEKVLNQLKDEKIIVGESAGGYILCPNIIMATWKNSKKNHEGLTDLGGLNLVPFLVTAHYSDDVSNVVHRGVATAGIRTYALRDGEAVVMNGKDITFVGHPQVFDSFK